MALEPHEADEASGTKIPTASTTTDQTNTGSVNNQRDTSTETRILRFANRIRRSWWFLAYTLQTVYAMLYTPIIGIIQTKFHDRSAFDTHSTYIFISLFCFVFMGAGFGFIIFVAFHEAEGGDIPLFPSPLGYEIMCSLVIVSVITSPLSLVLIPVIPDERLWIGYLIMGFVASGVLSYIFRRLIFRLRDRVRAICLHFRDG